MNELHFYEKGETGKPAVICIHGLLGSARNLHRIVEAIAAAGFHAIAYDQRGHGHSAHSKDYSLHALASDVFKIQDRLGLKSSHLVGHSLGARVSLAATGLFPQRVRSLTMLDSGIQIREAHLASLRAIIDPLPESYPSRAEADLALSNHSTMMKQFLLANLRAQGEPPHMLRWVFDLHGIREELLRTIQTDQTETWRSVTCPALVARGQHSESMLPEDLHAMLKLNPRAQGATIENAGHWVHAENFARTVELVIGFLKSIEE